jgi:uncharacterized protein (UPF0548 family)
LCLAGALALAALYAWGHALPITGLDIPAMLRWHAPANALGFVVLALVAWTRYLERLWPREVPDLAAWEAKPTPTAQPSARDAHDRHEAELPAEPPGPPAPDGPFARAAAAILRYDIFPRSVLSPLVRRAPIQLGDTIGARYCLFGAADLVFASRVIARFEQQDASGWRTGFTYKTLDGHPELGEETFEVRKDAATGSIRVRISAWSRPGRLVTRLFYPLGRSIQRRAGRAAVAHLRALAGRRS